MKRIITLFLFILPAINLTSACLAQPPSKLLNNVIFDYTQQMSKDWSNYEITEYFSKQKSDFHYLALTFEKSVVSDSTNIESLLINLSEVPDSEGGYELNLLKITYPNLETSSTNYSKIINSPNKNLKGGKIFMGYTAKQCDKEIILISSPAVATDEIKSYFSHFQESTHLCR